MKNFQFKGEKLKSDSTITESGEVELTRKPYIFQIFYKGWKPLNAEFSDKVKGLKINGRKVRGYFMDHLGFVVLVKHDEGFKLIYNNDFKVIDGECTVVPEREVSGLLSFSVRSQGDQFNVHYDKHVQGTWVRKTTAMGRVSMWVLIDDEGRQSNKYYNLPDYVAQRNGKAYSVVIGSNGWPTYKLQ